MEPNGRQFAIRNVDLLVDSVPLESNLIEFRNQSLVIATKTIYN